MSLDEITAQVRHLIESGDLDTAQAHLDEHLQRLTLRGEQRLPWAQLAEEAGALDLAHSQLRAAVTECEAPAVMQALAELEADLGQDLTVPFAAPETGVEANSPSAADIARFIHRFCGREGVYARQWVERQGRHVSKTGYSPVRAPLTADRVREHLAGEKTLGCYLVRHDQTVTYFVLDLDLTRKALALTEPAQVVEARLLMHNTALRIHQQLATIGLTTVLEDSGYKGRHLWGFLAEPLTADLVHRLGRAIRSRLELPPQISLEFFPKQRHVAPGGLGNLVKLPLGIHQRSGRASQLLDADGSVSQDVWAKLRSVRPIGREVLMGAFQALRTTTPHITTSHRPSAPTAPSTDDVDRAADEAAVARIIGRCPSLRMLLAEAARDQRLTHDEQVVLTHSLGHFDAGVLLLQRLFARCPEVPARMHPQRRKRGHPISCARIRARLPSLTSRNNCHCTFDDQSATYPNPTLHAAP